MLGVSSLVTSKLLCCPETGRASTLPQLRTYARNLIRREREYGRPRSTESLSKGEVLWTFVIATLEVILFK